MAKGIAGFHKMCYFECRKFQYEPPQDLRNRVENNRVKLGVGGVLLNPFAAAYQQPVEDVIFCQAAQKCPDARHPKS